jgi:pyruvyl transferase EpsO
METSRQLITRLQSTIGELLAPFVPDAPYALLDFPNHPNVGDSAIWLGTLRFFSESHPPSYVSGPYNCNWNELEAAIGPDGTIFIHGGGNFGDLWLHHHTFREKVIGRFSKHKIVQLPQTVHFESADNVAHTARLIESHGSFTLFVRDSRSFDFAVRSFQCEVILCPDMAFCLGPLPLRRAFESSALLLLRTDNETAGAHSFQTKEIPENGDIVRADWLIEPPATRTMAKVKTAAHFFVSLLGGSVPYESLRANYYRRLAQTRFERGIKLLSAFDYVVSDRLHAHILCTLLGIPHVMMDNSYGKISSFARTWSTEWDGARFSDTLPRGLKQAHLLYCELRARDGIAFHSA